jgi:hypothetical protein
MKESTDKCPICYQRFRTNRFYGNVYAECTHQEEREEAILDRIQLLCGHSYHYECIYRMLEHQLQPCCPICRQAFLDNGRMNAVVYNLAGYHCLIDIYPDLLAELLRQKQYISIARGFLYLGTLSLVYQYWHYLLKSL